MPELAIGCSGFSYPHWRGNFYPEGLAQKHWFEHYATVFKTVELNVTFYRLPKPETFSAWRQETPPDFLFAIKGSRFITHIKRLLDPEEALEHFFDAALELGEKLKVVLWQLSPGFAVDMARFSRFLECLRPYRVRNVFEFRHKSWLTDEIVALCRKYNAALCMADAPDFVNDLPLTADFVYLRRHGHGDHGADYSSRELARDAERIRGYMERGKDVYIYFNNDVQGYAPKNAQELQGMFIK